jgi:phage terminase large subunit-like protein
MLKGSGKSIASLGGSRFLLQLPAAGVYRRIDPSGCGGEEDQRSDEIGIVALGLGHDGIARVLEDATGRYSPDGWANKTLEVSDRWKADKIVAEVNYGGAMVEATIRTARRYASIGSAQEFDRTRI